MRFETWYQCDLRQMVQVQNSPGVLFAQDKQGNQIGVEITDNGQPITVSGDVLGYVIRGDNYTLPVTGAKSDNRAWIVLPQSAYTVEGPLDIVLKINEGEDITTVLACRVYVKRSSTDAVVDPDHVIPSLEELLAQIGACEAAAQSANAAASSANTAADNANAKATLADEKAALANSKAGLADTAAANANAKATLADEKAAQADTAAGRANDAAAALENMDGTAQTLAPDASATVLVSTVDGHYRLTLGIPQGIQGETGTNASITATAVAYQNSISGTTVPTGTWLDQQPATPQGQYLWTRTTLTWNNGQSTILYTVTYMGLDGQGAVQTVDGNSPDANGNAASDHLGFFVNSNGEVCQRCRVASAQG